MLEVSNLRKTIAQSTILEDASLVVAPGTITGIIGRNGAGKTTLLRTMMGILLPDAGEVRYEEQSVYAHPEVKVNLLFIPDTKDLLTGYSAQEIARLYAAIYPGFDPSALAGWMQQFSLPANKKIRYFSKGMRALFYLALAFAARTAVVLLDEPTEGLDPIYKKQCLQLMVQEVAERHPAVVISSHRLDELQAIGDQAVFLKDGRTEAVNLMRAQEHYRKLQVAYEAGLPAEVSSLPNVHLLQQSGRIYTLLIEEPELAKTLALLESTQPLLMEDLPLSLEDLFVSKLGGDHVVQHGSGK